MHPTAFNAADFGDENARRLSAYLELASRARMLAQQLPADRRDAFFELVQYPVEAAAAFNERVLRTDKALAYGLQHRASANEYAALAQAAEKRVDALTRYYNTTLAQGKWRYMMDAARQRLEQFRPQMEPEWRSTAPAGATKCGLAAEGGTFFASGVQAAHPRVD
jgi:hypothetical protein